MQNNLPELVSRIRYELFSTSKEVKYLSNLFQYFNAIYSEINQDRETEKNPAGALKSTAELGKSNYTQFNHLFERVYTMLKDDIAIERNASADLMLLYSIGFEAKFELGELNELNKTTFFKKIIEQYNREFHSSFTSLDDFILAKSSSKHFHSADDY